MSDPYQKLLAVFTEQRDALTRFLARRLGNDATAEDLTQEAWLRIASGGAPAIANPRAYLFRIAANLAVDHQRSEARRPLAAGEIDALLDVPDEAPDASAIAASRDELAFLQRALDELPARRRAIFLAARLGAQTHREIAERHGISTRAVEINVQRALEHCARRLEKNLVRRFGPRAPESS
ncbi:RNA polymerase sigma factor [Reyranella sp. CPCC 100927]|uniref:RNA polymerase sigma factor n=1 Tax=Reyranella sp. CPCC 100927 TaxID=2599616 RepID=UPI0011B3EA4E|nr:RNA polymerase sigma factor [Reyranella sp. CPCC 100927]TWT14793.1 RNA polymerase sigma factor [Reyranella sp. CPCC 100927]